MKKTKFFIKINNTKKLQKNMFIIFAGEKYYPLGGAYDIISVHNNLNKALIAFDEATTKYEWVHIFDTYTSLLVKEFKK